MSKEIKAAAAQFHPIKGDIESNINAHLKLIDSAVAEKADLIVFPELSLTGYEPELAVSLCFSESAFRSLPFQAISALHNLVIVVGAPIAVKDDKPRIGAIVFRPDDNPLVCCKMNLHGSEVQFFSRGTEGCVFKVGGLTFGLAICADSLAETYVYSLKEKGADYCLAPSLITENGYKNDTSLLRQYAEKFQVGIIMSNYVGESGGWSTTGKSLMIDRLGEIQSQATQDEEEIIAKVCS